jgi:hypothetical protein
VVVVNSIFWLVNLSDQELGRTWVLILNPRVSGDCYIGSTGGGAEICSALELDVLV